MGGGLIVKELGGGVGGDGRRKQVSLAEQTAKFFQGFALRSLLDALGGHVDLPLASEGQKQFDGVAAGAIGEHVVDERAIDFQEIDGGAAQLKERERASPVAVDGGVNPKLLELGENVEGRAGIGGGVITFCLVGTAWLTARRREGETSRMDWGRAADSSGSRYPRLDGWY